MSVCVEGTRLHRKRDSYISPEARRRTVLPEVLKTTRDSLFPAFGASFIIEGLNRCAVLFIQKPNGGNHWIYLIRLLSMILILVAILRKNLGAK